VPSGGALYPLEFYFHSVQTEGLEPGLYHYNPAGNRLAHLQRGDLSRALCQALVQPNLVTDSSAMLFITAMFERNTFKYGNRGYRFTLLEAGHAAQNVNLMATGLGLGIINIGGFFDRQIDEILGLDGLSHSTIYMLVIGGAGEEPGKVAAVTE
jgi:SagB-type dehydrogenase family enzyme